MVKDVVCDPWDDPHELGVVQLPLVGENTNIGAKDCWATCETEKRPRLGFLNRTS